MIKLKDAGVTHLKVVGRGNSIDNMEQDVSALRKALDMLKLIDSKKDYINLADNVRDNNKQSNNIFENKIKEELFQEKCSKECYY